jgi:hypothetical protein
MARFLRMRSSGISIAVDGALFWFLTGLVSLFVFCPHDAEAAQFKISPSVMVSEEYNDNIFLTPTDKQEDYITRIVPGFDLVHNTSFWSWKIDYAYDYRYYARDTVQRDTTYIANLLEHAELIDNAFYIDMTDAYQRVSLNVARNYTQESLFLNQTEQNIFTLTPYLNLTSGPSHTVQVGYRFANIWYKDPTAIDENDHIGYLSMSSPISSNVTITGGVLYTRGLNRVAGYFKSDVITGPVYSYAPNSVMYCELGETWLRFAGYKNIHHLLWDIGISHHYSTLTLKVETKTDYVTDPLNSIKRVDELVATLTRESTTRTSLSGVVGWYEYRNAATDHLEQTEYSLTGHMQHILTPRWTVLGEISNSILRDYLQEADTYIYQIMTRFERKMLPDLTFAMNYLYTYTYSPDIYSQNSRNNRFSVEITKNF